MHVVAAPDAFKGSASARSVAAAIGAAVRSVGGSCDEIPLADGGEGFVDVLGGANRVTTVVGPLGDPVEAGWRFERGRTAIIEMASASGLELVGGAKGNDPIAASTYGTGELIATAVEAGARRVIVGVGGSATTDGGLGALRALHPSQRMRGVELVVAVDVRTRFLSAAEVFAAQKGASPSQVELLSRRLQRLAGAYRDDYGIDVTELDGGGAGGGLAGGLAVVGARICSGFSTVAEEVDLDEKVESADLVVTGEGFLDRESFDGKVVGGVHEMAAELGVPVLAIAGEVLEEVQGVMTSISLSERFGVEEARADPLGCVERAVADYVSEMSAPL